MLKVDGSWCEIPVARANEGDDVEGRPAEARRRARAAQAYDLTSGGYDTSGGRNTPTPPCRDPPSRYPRLRQRRWLRSLIKQLIHATANSESIGPLHGLNLILTLPTFSELWVLWLIDGRQKPLCCAIIGHHSPYRGAASVEAPTVKAKAEFDGSACKTRIHTVQRVARVDRVTPYS